MSSLRNAVKRVTHKERAQPAKRKRLGLLEKKSDYQERSRNYALKRRRLDALVQRAAFRNPDEFNKKMVNQRTKGGVHQVTFEGLDNDTIRAINNLDERYLRMERSKEQARIERLLQSLHFVEAAGSSSSSASDGKGRSRQHVLFVDDTATAKSVTKAELFDTVPEAVDRPHNRPRNGEIKSSALAAAKLSATEQRRVAKQRERAYDELERRLDRRDKMDLALRHLEAKRLVAGKGRKFKVKGAENGKPAVYKWKQQRKR